MGGYWVPVEHIALMRAALQCAAADNYADDADRHADALAEYAVEQVALAARELVAAVDAAAPEARPFGWPEVVQFRQEWAVVTEQYGVEETAGIYPTVEAAREAAGHERHRHGQPVTAIRRRLVSDWQEVPDDSGAA
jgi:hypothetical protein